MSSDLANHVRRFFRGFRSALSPAELAQVEALLSPEELSLFRSLQGRERRHAMDVLRWLQAQADPSRELQVAALVHNVGKGHIHLHERVLYVILDKLDPKLLARLADPSSWRLRRGFALLRDHPPRGADLLAEIGSAPRVCELVRHHHDAPPSDDRELAWLIEADARC